MSIFRASALALVLVTTAGAGVARADGFIVPFYGVNFAGDAGGGRIADAFEAKRHTWGASFAFMGGGVFGVEGDVAYSPDFFGKTDLGGSSVLTLTGNLLLGIPFGGQQGFGIRPYGLVGVGAIRPEGEGFDNNLLDFGDYKAAWTFGGGVMMFFTTHVGIRGDLRYIRTFEAVELLDIEDAGDENLDFGRGSIGLVVRF
jgi:opacity protein-like surface antigen